MTKKHYINELHKLGYALLDYYERKSQKREEAYIYCEALLKIIKDILGNDFGYDDKELTQDQWKFSD